MEDDVTKCFSTEGEGGGGGGPFNCICFICHIYCGALTPRCVKSCTSLCV